MSLKLVFSWFADRGSWPEFPGEGKAVFDSDVVGPIRLLDHVETMLGLGAPTTAGVKRIAVYRHKLKSAGADRFWAQSIGVDSWSTARELLNWRDELIESGWRPDVKSPVKRLADLAAAERAGNELPVGFADRVRQVREALKERPKLSLAFIELIDAREDLPIGWRRLFDLLEACDVNIIQRMLPERLQERDDLSLLLSPFDAEGMRPELQGDASVAMLTADTELATAEAIAGWLATDPSGNDNLVFVLGKDSSLLDHALHHAGLPRIGASTSSAHRALLQILPLTFALTFDPPDPNTLLDFLLLPVSPLPRWAANKLASCVIQTPGIGGPRWNDTFAEIAQMLAEKEPLESEDKRSEKLRNWRAFVEPERHHPDQGIPCALARTLADHIAQWAAARFAFCEDDLFVALSTTASDLSSAIDAADVERFDRLLIERMIEQVIGAGIGDPTARPEASPWRAVSHPGAIWGPAETIVWWHFADSGEGTANTVWDRHEREALEQAGTPLDDPEVALRCLAASWERPLRFVKKKLLLVCPDLSAGTDVKTHPLWHALIAGRRHTEEKIGQRAEIILHQSQSIMAGRTIARVAVGSASLPERRSAWAVPKETIEARDYESASSLGSLLSCPLKWTLSYASVLHVGARQSLTGEDALIGNLAHQIARELFAPGEPPDTHATIAKARTRLEGLLPEMAATLLLPGAARELAAVRKAIPEALGELTVYLRNNKLTVVATEQEFAQKDSLGQRAGIRGAIDLLARDRNGRPVIIDLKWQRTDKYRRKEIADGVAIQLAVYARQIDQARQNVQSGYFMLKQKRFVTGDADFAGSVVHVDGPDLRQTWLAIEKAWGGAMDEIAGGTVRAPYEAENLAQDKFEDPILMTPPKCAYCDFSTLCGRQ